MVGFGDGPVFDVSCCEVSSAGQPVAHQDADDGADDPVAVQGDLELLDLMTRVQCRFGVAGRCPDCFRLWAAALFTAQPPTDTFILPQPNIDLWASPCGTGNCAPTSPRAIVQRRSDGQSTSQGVA